MQETLIKGAGEKAQKRVDMKSLYYNLRSLLLLWISINKLLHVFRLTFCIIRKKISAIMHN